MKKIILFILLTVSILTILYCEEKHITNNKITEPFQFDLNAYHRIKINSKQIDELNKTRFITLTKDQQKLLKNKVKKFIVSAPINPEGWFGAYWIKPDEVIVGKATIDLYDDLLDHKIEKFLKEHPEDNQSNKNTIFINIGLDGNFYYLGKMTDIESLKKQIKRISELNKNEPIDVNIYKAPIEDVNLKNKTDNDFKSLRNYINGIREIYFKQKRNDKL